MPHWLAAQLDRAGIDFQMEDNSFVKIADWERAQQLAMSFSVTQWERKFHELAARFCPVLEKFQRGYHWSVMQVEYSLDLVFKRREQLAPLYEQISRHAVLTVRVADMARFWDKRYSPEAKATSDFKTLVEGTRVRHTLGRQSLKMYDKGGRVPFRQAQGPELVEGLRIEATSNDITFFRHSRKVISRDGTGEYKMAPLKKSIYSLRDVVELLSAACQRYPDFIGMLEDDTPQRHDIDRVSRTVRDQNHRSNRKNGYSKKTMKSASGSFELETPRDRAGLFEPQIVKKHQTHLTSDIEDKILSMFGLGMSYRDIAGHIADFYGIDISNATISAVTDRLIPELQMPGAHLHRTARRPAPP